MTDWTRRVSDKNYAHGAGCVHSSFFIHSPFTQAGHIMNIKQSAMLTRNMEDHLYVYHNLRILDNIELYDKLDEFYEWDADDEGSDDEEEGN